MNTTEPLKVMIAAGEVSGDMYGGALIRALREQFPNRALDVRGMGGDAMAAEGAKILHHTDALGAMGLGEVLAKLRYFKQVMKDMVNLAATWKPDVLITLDYYSFNIALAEKVKALGVRTVHYISPKVWVWRSGRIYRMAKAYDLLLCIFPFEPALYEPAGLRAIYVGHPLVEQAAATRAEADPKLPWDTGERIALLPGSRSAEIRSILPTFLKAACEIEAAQNGNCSFIIPVPTPKMRIEVERVLLKHACPRHLAVIDGNARHVMRQAKAAMIASGTATLEACLMNCPTVLAYHMNIITELMARILLRSFRFAGLVNIIAGKGVMTELLQRDFTAHNTAKHLLPYLSDTPERQAILDAYADVRAQLGEPGATERTAKAIADLLLNR
jgi:lipid-A-disaccharide synthase